jgi:hypothetical protein
MSKELGLLNFICLLAAVAFLALAIISVLSSGDFLTIDNLFIIAVSMLMALLFAVNPLLYLRSEGKLPLPGMNKAPSPQATLRAQHSPGQLPASTPPLLDAKGRAVPPDVKAIMARMGQSEVRAEARDA